LILEIWNFRPESPKSQFLNSKQIPNYNTKILNRAVVGMENSKSEIRNQDRVLSLPVLFLFGI